MNPYRPLYSKSSDIVGACVIAILWLALGTILLRVRASAKHQGSEGYCWPASLAFVWLCVFFTVVSVIGIVFLAWLQVQTGLWFFWDLLWAINIICTFRVLPVAAGGLVVWDIIDMLRNGATRPRIFRALACPFALAINIAFYFATEIAMRK